MPDCFNTLCIYLINKGMFLKILSLMYILMLRSSIIWYCVHYSIAATNSLHSPSNHKSVGFNDDYNQCHCPQLDEEIKSHDVQSTIQMYESMYQTVSHHYNSALKCSSTTSCTVQHTGEAWTPSALPPVLAVTDVLMSVATPFLSCQFTPIAEKAHNVKW